MRRAIKKGEKIVGSAVVISKEWAITAAHVFESENDKNVSLEVNGQQFQISKIAIHPDYKSTNSNHSDLALIKLDKKYKGNLAKLYHMDKELGLIGTIVGFGSVRNALAPNGNKEGKIAGQNVIDAIGNNLLNNFWAKKSFAANFLIVDLDSPTETSLSSLGEKTPIEFEYIIDGGDSGGGLFVQENGRWWLSGINARSVHNFDRLKNSFDKFGFYGSVCGFTRISNKVWIEQTQKPKI